MSMSKNKNVENVVEKWIGEGIFRNGLVLDLFTRNPFPTLVETLASQSSLTWAIFGEVRCCYCFNGIDISGGFVINDSSW